MQQISIHLQTQNKTDHRLATIVLSMLQDMKDENEVWQKECS